MGRKKLTIEFVKASFEAEDYILLSEEYINCETKLNFICPNGHEHSITWHSWQKGIRCSYCAGNAKISFEFVKESFKKEGYILLNTIYVNAFTKLNYLCAQGHKHSIKWNDWKTGYRCPVCYKNNNIGQGCPSWKGGVSKRNVSLYDTYNPQIFYCEETRRDPNDLDILQVKCIKCNNWFTPNLISVVNRVAALNNNDRGESRFYCSNNCKQACPIYRRSKYSAEEKRSKINPNFTSAELKIWSREVLKRADYICEYCGEPAEHAHHIQPKKLEPFLVLDPDNGVACCIECHYKYGHKEECSTGNLANIVC